MNNANYHKNALPYADYNQYHPNSNDGPGSQPQTMLFVRVQQFSIHGNTYLPLLSSYRQVVDCSLLPF